MYRHARVVFPHSLLLDERDLHYEHYESSLVKTPPHTGGWISRDLGAPPTRDRDARDRERPVEVVSRARWDTCLRTCAVVAVIATVAAIATGEAGDNPRGATIAAVGTTGERGRRPREAVARETRTVVVGETVIEDGTAVGGMDEAAGASRRCSRSGRRARAWRR